MIKYIAMILLHTALISMGVSARTINVTAEFSPSVSNPSNNRFTNTTPIGGYCAHFTNNCLTNGWFSVSMGITSSPTENIVSGDGVSFNMPSAYRDVEVTNTTTGKKQIVKFAINGFGARKNDTNANGVASGWSGGSSSSWLYQPAGCSSTGWANGNNTIYTWFWRWPNRNDTTFCTKTNTRDNRGTYPRLDTLNMMYMLTTPNPLEMEDGVYEGSITYSVAGSGADINIGGPKYRTSDDQLIIKFVLTVTHELKVNIPNTDLTLHACRQGNVCSEKESAANWERAIITNISPTLTAKTDFTLTSSGSFTAWLRCEYTVGEHCGMKSGKTDHTVPVKTLLTLPGNITTTSGAPIRNHLLRNVKDLNQAFFSTAEFAQNAAGNLQFEVAKEDVSTMRRTAPDNYSGVVTVIFDPSVW